MRVFAVARISFAVIALTIPASSALAQERIAESTKESKATTVEVTPYVALGSPGASSIGAFVTFPLAWNFSFETELGYRRGEGNLNALASSANLLYDLPHIGRAVPYLAAGAGLAQYGAPFALPNGSIGTEPEITLTINAGGGVKIPVNDKWGMRTDVRWSNALARDASESFRVAHGISFGGRRP